VRRRVKLRKDNVEIGVQTGRNQRRALASWLFVAAVFALCGILGLLQYRWIGAVSVAERETLQASLQTSLNRLSQDFNSEISAACRAVLPVVGQAPDAPAAEAGMVARYEQWKSGARHSQVFRRIAIAEFAKGGLVLRIFDPSHGAFLTAEWPQEWTAVKNRLERIQQRRGGPGGPPPFDNAGDSEGTVFQLPLFSSARPMPFGRREIGWSIFELNLDYLRSTLLPELVQRYVAAGGNLDYQVEVVTRTPQPAVIYRAGGSGYNQVMANADASVSLFENPFDLISGRGAGHAPPPARGTGIGRWQMYVRHRAGSLEAVVAQARLRSVAVTSCVLLLMFGTLIAWIRFTRRAQRLAGLQMDFVAGVSHELRTPLAVIHTAAYNLKGGVTSNPAQVEKYGALIHQESGRLKEMVEQVLRFSRAQAGHIVQEPGPVWIASVIADALEAGKTAIQSAHCTVEQNIESELPLILGDPNALEHAIGNLIGNAVKYGAGAGWIGISANQVVNRGRVWVEVRVADHGPGIPAAEQAHLFDPFFRGRRAQEDQVHGTGLGLSIVKGIVEAHGGTVQVKSEPGKGAEFILRVPAAPPEKGHEFAHSFSRG
jgi:signal transduction histidine kinase